MMHKPQKIIIPCHHASNYVQSTELNRLKQDLVDLFSPFSSILCVHQLVATEPTIFASPLAWLVLATRSPSNIQNRDFVRRAQDIENPSPRPLPMRTIPYKNKRLRKRSQNTSHSNRMNRMTFSHLSRSRDAKGLPYEDEDDDEDDNDNSCPSLRRTLCFGFCTSDPVPNHSTNEAEDRPARWIGTPGLAHAGRHGEGGRSGSIAWTGLWPVEGLHEEGKEWEECCDMARYEDGLKQRKMSTNIIFVPPVATNVPSETTARVSSKRRVRGRRIAGLGPSSPGRGRRRDQDRSPFTQCAVILVKESLGAGGGGLRMGSGG
ncbi:hypothetical protein B0J11DRAFT_593585 [Dendryphion nanum]|uniref:Uncharacterized protein n=1 Tax=Dendryphion nanum TaxID=256645 RepID=A0A9P9DAQ5_9PLEO|nr:hypothetical protein B0J11DRAFT_593585 [Dendryphion nanum]